MSEPLLVLITAGSEIEAEDIATALVAERLAAETHMNVYRAEDPVTCVARGAGAIVGDLDRYHKVLATAQRGVLSHAR